MQLIKKCLLAAFLLLFLISNSFESEEGISKTRGYVKKNGSNIRAGDNINFESLCKLKKGDSVKIIDKRHSWFKVILPKQAYLYIKNDYVELDSEQEMIGTVNALRVNLRAGPDTKYSIIGQVSSPEKLKVIEELDGWYKIEPLEDSAGWIHSSQIVFEPPAQRPNLRLKAGALQPQGNLTFSSNNQ